MLIYIDLCIDQILIYVDQLLICMLIKCWCIYWSKICGINQIKLVWVVIVGFDLGSYKFYQLLFCAFLVFSQCMCVVHLLFVFLGLYITHLNSFVLCFVLSGHVSLNHSLGQVNINPPGLLHLPYKSILVWMG